MSQRKRRRRRFAQLAERYMIGIARMAAKRADGDRDLADDLMQEGLIALWRIDAEDLRDARCPRDFVWVCVRNAMLNWLRHERRWLPA